MTGLRPSLYGAVAVLAAALIFASPAGASPQPGFRLLAGAVTPKQSIADSVDPVRVHLRFRAKRPLRVSVRINRLSSGKTARRLVAGMRMPGRGFELRWDGRTQRGKLAPAGLYELVAGPRGGPFRRVGRIRMHGHEFPVDGPHGVRGYIGRFGAPRVDGRTHQGFDITAACGTPLVAVRAGRIIKKAYDPELYGNFVVLKGEGERRTYKYAHLIWPAPVKEGQKVRAGRRLGSVGQTGNAASTPCHLHIEIRSQGKLLDPEPLINSWDW